MAEGSSGSAASGPAGTDGSAYRPSFLTPEIEARTRKRRRIRTYAIATAAVVFGAVLSGYFFYHKEDDVLRVGYFPNLTHSQALVGFEKGYFREHLPGIKIQTYVFNAGPSVIEAMFANKLDISYIGPSPTINGYVKSEGKALRVVAGATSGGAVFIVRSGANIDSVGDLAGKKLASPQLGNTQDVALRHYLKQNGLKTKEEGGSVELVAVANADILTLFKKGELDGAWVPEPWGARLIHEGNGRLMLDERTLWENGSFVTANIIVTTKLLREKPDVVRAFVEAHVEATLWIQEHTSEALTVINDRLLELTGKALAADVLDESFSRMNVTYDPVRPSLLAYADWAYDLGFLGTSRPNLGGLYSLGMLNDVLRQKGLPAVG